MKTAIEEGATGVYYGTFHLFEEGVIGYGGTVGAFTVCDLFCGNSKKYLTEGKQKYTAGVYLINIFLSDKRSLLAVHVLLTDVNFETPLVVSNTCIETTYFSISVTGFFFRILILIS